MNLPTHQIVRVEKVTFGCETDSLILFVFNSTWKKSLILILFNVTKFHIAMCNIHLIVNSKHVIKIK